MSELEHDLRVLAGLVDYPPAPELARRVRHDLPRRDAQRWRLRVSLATVFAALAVGAAFAVPSARSTILRFFGVGAVRVEIVDQLPVVRRAPLYLGVPVDSNAVPFRLLHSKLLGPPDRVYLLENTLTQLYGSLDRPRLLVGEIGSNDFRAGMVRKLQRESANVRAVMIRGATGKAVWLRGPLHVVQFPGGPPRLATNTLVFRRGDMTVRIEGALSLAQARRIAESLR